MHTENWSKKDFYCFLMIYGANADLKIETTEASRIERIYGPERFLKMLKVYEGKGEEEHLEWIREYKNANYEGLEDFQNAVDKLMKVYMADGEFSEEEAAQLGALVSKV